MAHSGTAKIHSSKLDVLCHFSSRLLLYFGDPIWDCRVDYWQKAMDRLTTWPFFDKRHTRCCYFILSDNTSGQPRPLLISGNIANTVAKYWGHTTTIVLCVICKLADCSGNQAVF